MACYFISRHPATKVWVKQQGIRIDHWLEHLQDMASLSQGDVVYGTLPIQLVADLNARRIRYVHFSITLPEKLRGKELSVNELSLCEPRLEEFEVIRR